MGEVAGERGGRRGRGSLPCRLLVLSRALALSARSPLSVLPSNRMSIASCLELSMKLFCIVLVAERAASPAWYNTGANNYHMAWIKQV